VVTTQVALPASGPRVAFVTAAGVSVGIADDSSQQPVFAGADGILGLAYPSLNKAYDLTNYLLNQGEQPLTYPWPIPASQVQQSPQAFNTFINNANATTVRVSPCLTQFVQEGLLPNKFALWVWRALQNLRTSTPATDQSNWGTLILGGGENFFADQVVGPFYTAEVLNDSYYELNLIAVQVGDNPPIPALPGLPVGNPSNAILDSGTANIKLQTALHAAVIAELTHAVPLPPEFLNLIVPQMAKKNAGAPEDARTPSPQTRLSSRVKAAQSASIVRC
jgi:hypothetical protein